MVEYFSLRRIKRRFIFLYNWRAIDAALVRLVALNRSQKNYSHLVISFLNHHHPYYFVRISSIKSGREVVEDLSLRRIEQIFQFAIIGELSRHNWYVLYH